MKKLGVIGGLGPMATAHFFQLLVEMTAAGTDQEHMEILIYNCPSIPDRTQYILGKSTESPVEQMVAIGRQLEQMQVDLLAIPCVTAHYFYQELEKEIHLPIVHAVWESARYLWKRGYRKVGIMATDATVQMRIFEESMSKFGIVCVYPKEGSQKKVMHLIYENVKAGTQVERELFDSVAEELFSNGAEVILLGCTELSILKQKQMTGAGCLDVTEVLAKICVEKCAKLKQEYEELITA